MNRLLAAALAASLVVLGLLPGCFGGSGGGEPGAADSIAAPGTDIYTAPLNAQGEELVVGEPTPLVQRPGYDNQPAFTPGGTRLLFTSLNEGQADVHRITLGTFDETRITSTPESEYSPTPRPDDRISVVRVEEDGRQRLWQYGAFGRPIAPVLPEADSVGYHAWMDPTHVAFFVLGSPPTLHVADVTTRVDTVVADSIGRSLQPVPGRPAVSFVRVGADSSTTIHLADRTDSLTTRLLARTPGSGRSVDHAWTPGGTLLTVDGTTLYAWRSGDATWQAVRDLAPLQVTRLAVSPDGTQIALVVREN
jgi:hypothetical protein